MIGWSGQLTNVDACWVRNPARQLSPSYAVAEYLHTVDRSDKLAMLEHYAPHYGKYAEDGRLPWAYGFRIADNTSFDQLLLAHDLLRADPDTRQCVVSVWKPDDLERGLEIATSGEVSKGYVPCTLTWQFLLREGKLHMKVDVRSQDVWLGMPYDIFIACQMLRTLAGELKVEVGTYSHTVGSLHVYERHFKQCSKALASGPSSSKRLVFGDTNFQLAAHAVELETKIRELKILDYDAALAHGFDCLDNGHQAMLACVAARWNISLPCKSPVMKEAMEQC